MNQYTWRLSTDLLPHMFRPNTYSGNYDPRENDYLSCDLDNLTVKQQENYRDDFNYGLFFEHCAEHQREVLLILSKYVQDVLPSFSISKRDWYKINRPTNYNYWWDRVNFDFTLDLPELFKYIESLDKDILDTYLYDNFYSYDWFSSFMPQSKADLISFLTEWDNSEDIDRWVAAIVNYIISLEADNIEHDIRDLNLWEHLWDVLTYNDTKKFRKIYDKHCN